jgi:IS30 family transposase
MRRRTKRRFYTPAESADIWDRWRRGEGLWTIARAFGKSSSSIYSHISPTGGIQPPARRQSGIALTLAEREEISRGLVHGRSLRQIACGLGRAPSTISREVARNGGVGPYRAAASDKQAWHRALRPKPCKLVINPRLQRLVEAQLLHNWSPQQIAAWLKITYPEDEAFWVSHETIYRTLYVQTRGALKKELTEHLRTHRPIRRSRHSTAKADLRGRIPDTVSISERPASVEDRAVPGHWEGDLLCGSSNSYIITLVERHTRYVMLGKIPSRDTRTVVNALIKLAKKLPDQLYQSLTWDRGVELTEHKRFTMATDVQVCFCDPQSPWQRGSNENTNRLLRQYFPKGPDLSVHSQARLNYIARELNERPRETLGFETPKERFRACVAATTSGD